jgi:hypothetical protein
MKLWQKILSGSVWLLGIAGGMYALMSYSYTQGEVTAPVPATWPEGSAIPFDPGKPALVMFIHPKCPCTRASLDELSDLLSHCQGLVRASVEVVRPPGAEADWVKTGLRQQASAIPGLSVRVDEDAKEAQLFHASTSGTTLLYDGEGHLLFNGGITSSRGHEGDNAGLLGLEDLLHGRKPAFNHVPIYGCSLTGKDSDDPKALCKR